MKEKDLHDYVHEYLKISSYTACYALIIQPINGENIWAKIGHEPMDPL